MKTILKFCIAVAMVLGLAACGSASSADTGSDTITGTYAMHIQGEDYGCGVDRIVLTLDYKLDAVDATTFTVKERKQNTDWADPNLPVIVAEYDRTVTNAYLVDENGEKTDLPSKYAAIEMKINPNEGSPLLYTVSTGYNTYSDPYELTVALAEGARVTSGEKEVTSFTVDPKATAKTTSADMFTAETREYDGVKFNIAAYKPEEKSDKLFVWLNGAGEGGSADERLAEGATDVYITLLANKVTALAGEDFQKTLGGCNILVPQAPTMWMDDGRGNTVAGLRNSIYVEQLATLIDDYAAANGIKQIVIGGCSNGGYMTMNMAMNYGDKYQAYVPICEAMLDKYITDKDIKVLAGVPMYFVYSEDDTTVDPKKYEIPTIKRLKAAHAKNLHVSTTKHVVDTSGKYKDAKGKAYQYNGHWSWIYFDNDETKDEDGVSAFDWIAATLAQQ